MAGTYAAMNLDREQTPSVSPETAQLLREAREELQEVFSRLDLVRAKLDAVAIRQTERDGGGN